MFRQLRSAFPRWSSAVTLAVGGLLLLPVSPSSGQGKASGGFLSEAFVRVTANADVAKRIAGYGYADSVCVLAAWVDQNDTVSFVRPLTGGTSYIFLAAGDQDARVVNLDILDKDSRNILKQDGKREPDAVLEFTPNASGQYTLRLALTKSRDNLPCMCVVTVLQKNGTNVPLGNLDTCAKKITDVLAAADADVNAKSGKRLDFHKAKNQWALYGGILKESEELQIDNLSLGQGLKAFIAVGDTNTRDVDLFLLDRNGKTVASDERVDPDASFVYEPGPQQHSLKVRNFRATGPSLIFMSAFDVVNGR